MWFSALSTSLWIKEDKFAKMGLHKDYRIGNYNDVRWGLSLRRDRS